MVGDSQKAERPLGGRVQAGCSAEGPERGGARLQWGLDSGGGGGSWEEVCGGSSRTIHSLLVSWHIYC